MVTSATYTGRGFSAVSIPKWVKTDPTDVCVNVEELRRMDGQRVFMVANPSRLGVEFVAAKSMKDLAFYANYYDVFSHDTDPGKHQVILGNVYKAEVLPYSMNGNALEETAFFIYGKHILGQAVSLEHLTYKIETLILKRSAFIDEFAVILGRMPGDSVHAKLNKAIDRYSNRSLWREDKWALTDVNIP